MTGTVQEDQFEINTFVFMEQKKGIIVDERTQTPTTYRRIEFTD